MKISRYKKNIGNIFILIMAFLLIFLFLEIVLRIFYDETKNYGDYNRTNIGPGYLYYIDKETNLLHNIEDKKITENRYAIFDTEEISKDKNENEFRIVIIGDSFTVGGGVDNYEDTYFSQLKKILETKKINKELDYNILPFADSGLVTFQEYVLLKEVGLSYDPDFVILQYCDNDIGPIRSPFGERGASLIKTKTDIFNIDGVVVPGLPLIGKKLNSLLLRMSKLLRFISYKFNIVLINNSINDNNYFESFKSLVKIADICKKKEIPLIVINFPPAWEDTDQCGESKYYGGRDLHQSLDELLSNFDVPFINMCEHVDDVHSIRSNMEDSHGVHYNKEGYSIAAFALYDEILNILK